MQKLFLYPYIREENTNILNTCHLESRELFGGQQTILTTCPKLPQRPYTPLGELYPLPVRLALFLLKYFVELFGVLPFRIGVGFIGLAICCTFRQLTLERYNVFEPNISMGFIAKLLPQCLRIRLVVFKSRLKEFFPPSEKEIREMKVEFADWEESALSNRDA